MAGSKTACYICGRSLDVKLLVIQNSGFDVCAACAHTYKFKVDPAN